MNSVDGSLRTVRLLHPYPALLLSERRRRYLVISDIHIGFEEKYAEEGVHIQGSIEATMGTLSALLEEHKPDELIILGDVKYSVDRISYLEWQEVPRFFEGLPRKQKITVIPGNHDGILAPLLPRNVELLAKSSLLVGKSGLIHGHTNVSSELLPAKRLIMGHVHPRYSRKESPLSGRSIWLLLKVEKKYLFKEAENESLDIYVLPAFNKELTWAGFANMRGNIISPIIRKVSVHNGIQEAVIMTLEGDILGGLEALEYVL